MRGILDNEKKYQKLKGNIPIFITKKKKKNNEEVELTRKKNNKPKEEADCIRKYTINEV